MLEVKLRLKSEAVAVLAGDAVAVAGATDGAVAQLHVIGGRADRHGGAAVRLSGADHRGAAGRDRADCGAAGAAVLRHLLHRLVGRPAAQAAA